MQAAAPRLQLEARDTNSERRIGGDTVRATWEDDPRDGRYGIVRAEVRRDRPAIAATEATDCLQSRRAQAARYGPAVPGRAASPVLSRGCSGQRTLAPRIRRGRRGGACGGVEAGTDRRVQSV